MAWGAVAGAAVGVIGGAMTGGASKSAANTQAAASKDAAEMQLQAAQESIAEQRRQYDVNRSDLAPWRTAGGGAINKLAYLMGIDMPANPAAGSNAGNLQGQYNDALSAYNKLLAQGGSSTPQSWTKYGNYASTYRGGDEGGGWGGDAGASGLFSDQAKLAQAFRDEVNGGPPGIGWVGRQDILTPQQARSMSDGEVLAWAQQNGRMAGNGPSGGGIDQNALAAAKANVDGLKSQLDATTTTHGSDFGSLLKNFSLEDFQADPGYQFRVQQGEQGINRALASRGMFDSGAALKELDRFNSGIASDEFGNAYNRDASNKNRVANFLQSVAGLGQSAANTTAGLGANTASGIGNALMSGAAASGNYLTQGANAQASGIVGGANALAGGLSGAWNNYQSNQLMNKLTNFSPYNTADPSASSQWGGSYAGFNNPDNYG